MLICDIFYTFLYSFGKQFDGKTELNTTPKLLRIYRGGTTLREMRLAHYDWTTEVDDCVDWTQ